MDIKKLLGGERVVVSYLEPNEEIDSNFVKEFRKRFELTQTALANIMGIKKKTVEKWEQGKNKVNGSSVVLFTLLYNNPELIKKIRAVNVVDDVGNVMDFKTAFSSEAIQTTVIVGTISSNYTTKSTCIIRTEIAA